MNLTAVLRSFSLWLAFIPLYGQAQDLVPSSPSPSLMVAGDSIYKLNEYIYIWEDRSNQATPETIPTEAQFLPLSAIEPHPEYSYWVKISLENELENAQSWKLFTDFNSLVEVYSGDQVFKTGAYTPGEEVALKGNRFYVPIWLKPQESQTLFLKIKTIDQTIPRFGLNLISPEYWSNEIDCKNRYIFQGVFHGILWIMIFYNFFIFLLGKDKAYFYYALYLLANVGYFLNMDFFLSDFVFPQLPKVVVYLWPLMQVSLALYFQFMRSFLQTDKLMPHWDPYLKRVIAGILIFIGLELIWVRFVFNYPILDKVVPITFFFLLGFGVLTLIQLYKTQDKTARFFIAGSLTLVIFALASNLMYIEGGLSLSFQYILKLGVLLELVLFSLGLGYRIQNTENEKRSAQENLIKQLLENRNIQITANQELESKVRIRTQEIEDQKEALLDQSTHLRQANVKLQEAYERLKAAQSKLVESEKMASLGQLTAGIAHEINNPINFVAANINPLKRDLEDIESLLHDYQNLSKDDRLIPQLEDLQRKSQEKDLPFLFEEIHSLLQGIEVGADRTRAIVEGLRNFSRMDEHEIKAANIHEGVDSALMLLHNKLKTRIEVERVYGILPEIKCFPGKLNQAFMNILLNAIQAIDAKGSKGKILISTSAIIEHKAEVAAGEKALSKINGVKISIKDTGIGMDEATRERVFEPFFTTRKVGQGSGLGLSIAYGIIEQHGGKIEVFSVPEQGSEFVISLPIEPD